MKKNRKDKKEKPAAIATKAQNRTVWPEELKKSNREAVFGVPVMKVVAEIKGSDYFNVQARSIRIRLTHWLDLLGKP